MTFPVQLLGLLALALQGTWRDSFYIPTISPLGKFFFLYGPNQRSLPVGESSWTVFGSSQFLYVHRTLYTFLIRQFLLNNKMLNVVEMFNLSFPLDNEPLEDKNHVVFIFGLPAFRKAPGTRSVLNKCSFMYKYPRRLWCTYSTLRSSLRQRIEN